MLRGYRRYVLAFIGCLAGALALAVALSPRQVELSGNAGYQEQAAGYHAGGAECQPSTAKRLTGAEAFRRRIACQEAEEQHRLQANDLIQQRRAADAAEANAVFAFQQARIGAWGLALGFITMTAAIAAAFYAKGAAEAAQDSLKHATETSQAELRAYLRSDSETVSRAEDEGKMFTAVVTVRNAGATPATDVFANVQQEFQYRNGGAEELEPLAWPIGTLSPGAHIDLKIEGKLDEDADRAFAAQKGALYYIVRIRFRDNFGESWTYCQDLVVDKDALISGNLGTTDCRHIKNSPEEHEDPDQPELEGIRSFVQTRKRSARPLWERR